MHRRHRCSSLALTETRCDCHRDQVWLSQRPGVIVIETRCDCHRDQVWLSRRPGVIVTETRCDCHRDQVWLSQRPGVIVTGIRCDCHSGWCATPPSLWNICRKWPTPFDRSPLITYQLKEIAKQFNYDESEIHHRIGTTHCSRMVCLC